MKRKILISSVLVILLLTSVVLTGFGSTYEGNLHWAQGYVEKLEKAYNVEELLREKDLNAIISREDFEALLKKVIDSEHATNLQTLTREEVVSELVELWAKEIGRDLTKIAMPKILVYRDTAEINSRYRHNVMAAYFQEIAKGRGDRLFNPKELITYAEAVALVTRVNDAITSTKEKNFATITTYKLEENEIFFNFQLVNQQEVAKEVTFSSGQQYEITIVNDDNQEVYRYSDDKFFTMALITKSLEAGDSIQWQETWDFTDKEGNQLTEGSFKATIEILIMDEKMDRVEATSEIEFKL
ncbi:MAG: S-layer homology domain-containing protein [Clostridiaceae bacterium]|nr:S-layer homology domain-containing protein [Clostridiaceae bacterium]